MKYTRTSVHPSLPFSPAPALLSMWPQKDAFLQSFCGSLLQQEAQARHGARLALANRQQRPTTPSHNHGTTRQRHTAAPTLQPWRGPCKALLAAQQGRLHQQLGDHIGVQVGRRPAVLKVAALLHGHAAPHAHRRAAVGHAPAARTMPRRSAVPHKVSLTPLIDPSPQTLSRYAWAILRAQRSMHSFCLSHNVYCRWHQARTRSFSHKQT